MTVAGGTLLVVVNQEDPSGWGRLLGAPPHRLAPEASVRRRSDTGPGSPNSGRSGARTTLAFLNLDCSALRVGDLLCSGISVSLEPCRRGANFGVEEQLVYKWIDLLEPVRRRRALTQAVEAYT